VSLDRTGCAYPIALREADGGRLLEFDWEPTIRSVLDDMDAGATPGEIAARFHAALAGSIVAMARQVGLRDVALTGGCFQNRHLTEEAVRGLRRSGFRVHLHRLVPPNDGGIALGQVVAAALASGGRSI
jgi:hydrogenase maturation protein HypF